jgi:ribonuclease P protein component
MRPEHYDRQRRIVKTDEFSSVFRLRPAYRTENFVLYARPNTLGHARLGVVVAKRLAPRAVTRNLVKRIAREIFRKAELKGVDCIVRLSQPLAKRPKPASTRALRATVGAELSRLMQSQSALPAMATASP